MTAPAGFAPVARALVQTLRTNATLKAALTGMYEGVAPNGTGLPFLTYSFLGGTAAWQWGSVVNRPRFSVNVWATDNVEARTLDQLVNDTLWDVDLGVEQQSTLLCRRMYDVSDVLDVGHGRKVFQVGGVYQIWTGQSL